MKLSLSLVALLALPLNAAELGREGKIPTVNVAVGAPLAAPAIPTLPALPGGLPNLTAPSLPASAAVPQAAAPAAASAAAAMPKPARGGSVAAAAARSGSENRLMEQELGGTPGATKGEKLVQRRGEELKAAFEGPSAVADPEAPYSLDHVSVEPLPGRERYASPEDWRDEVLYSMMLDRFNRSARGRPEGDPKSGLTRHGGDLRGVIEKLDYIKESGVTTLLVSPVTQTVPEAYHGYAPIHFLAVDPRLGTIADMRELVKEAHARGLRVVLDLVVNHTGPVFEYEGGPSGSGWSPLDKARKKIGYWTNKLLPTELTDPERFTRRGVIGNWDDKDQAQFGDFPPNYRHLSTEDAQTQADLIKIAKWWINETDIDGLRLDAIRHVDQGFLKRFNGEIKAYAAKLGKKNFLLLGEDSTGVDAELNDKLDKGLDSLYNYPEFRRVLWALHGKAPTKHLEDSLNASTKALLGRAASLVRFIDLHDTYRFLRDGENPDYLKLAFAWLMFSIGIPLVYYGTEQAFRTSHQVLEPENGKLPADPENRQDMFAEGRFKTESSKGDTFNVNSPSFKFLRRLADLRKQYPALRRGYQYVRWSDPWGPGIYAFSRIEAGQEAVVATNTADQGRSATMYVDAEHSPVGTVFMDALDPAYTVTAFKPVEGGSQITVDVPPRGVRVLVKKA